MSAGDAASGSGVMRMNTVTRSGLSRSAIAWAMSRSVMIPTILTPLKTGSALTSRARIRSAACARLSVTSALTIPRRMNSLTCMAEPPARYFRRWRRAIRSVGIDLRGPKVPNSSALSGGRRLGKQPVGQRTRVGADPRLYLPEGRLPGTRHGPSFGYVLIPARARSMGFATRRRADVLEARVLLLGGQALRGRWA